MLLEAEAGARFHDLCRWFNEWSNDWRCQVSGISEDGSIARGSTDSTDTVIDQVVAVGDGQ